MIATKNAPVISTVTVSVSSMRAQFDASGDSHHGVSQWKSSEATTISRSASAMATTRFRQALRSPRCRRSHPIPSLELRVQQRRDHAEHQVFDPHRPAAQLGEPGEEADHAVEVEDVQQRTEERAE